MVETQAAANVRKKRRFPPVPANESGESPIPRYLRLHMGIGVVSVLSTDVPAPAKSDQGQQPCA
jgi:hypothetical protein